MFEYKEFQSKSGKPFLWFPPLPFIVLGLRFGDDQIITHDLSKIGSKCRITQMTREFNILTVMSILSLTGLVTKYPTIGAKITEHQEKPKLPRVDFIFYRGSPTSRVEAYVLSEVLTSSLRLASRG